MINKKLKNMKQKLKPYNPPAFINDFIDKCTITAENFELVMNHYHLSVQPELTRVQENELKQIENTIKFLEKLKIRVHFSNRNLFEVIGNIYQNPELVEKNNKEID